MTTLALRDVEIDGKRTDVLIEDGLIARIERGAAAGVSHVLDGRGGALLPGLWDHHVHLRAWAAARTSIDLTDGLDTLVHAAARLPTGTWIRATGYHESVSGLLDREALDRLVPDHPVRVQHRSGAMWVLNTRAIDAVGLEGEDHAGIEHDDAARPTGRVFGADSWLGRRIPSAEPDLGAVGDLLSSFGVVGVTDMTPDADTSGWGLLARAANDGRIRQHIVVTGGPPLIGTTPPTPLRLGPVKLYLADHSLPDLDQLTHDIRRAHTAGRTVAFHTVTRSSLALAVAALGISGSAPGDRIEHGAVVPDDLAGSLATHRLTVVTQPGFVAERGDQYLAEVDHEDVPHLYPCATLRDRGIAVGGSTDAPFGDPDPWRAIAAAVQRRSRAGQMVGPAERISPVDALGLFLADPDRPGGPARAVEPGTRADLCLLGVPLDAALDEPDAANVRATVVAGDVVHDVG